MSGLNRPIAWLADELALIFFYLAVNLMSRQMRIAMAALFLEQVREFDGIDPDELLRVARK